MDTVFKRAFDALEKPFKKQHKIAQGLFIFSCIFIVIAVGGMTGFEYHFDIYQVIFMGIIFFFIRRFFSLKFFEYRILPNRYFIGHQKALKEDEKAFFVLDEMKNFAQKLHLPKGIVLKSDASIPVVDGCCYIAVMQSLTHYILLYTPNFLKLDALTMRVFLAHEVTHLYNKDIEKSLILHRFFVYAWAAVFIQLCFLSFSVLGTFYVCLLLVFWFVFITWLKAYMRRREESLADIGAVRLTGLGDSFACYMKEHLNLLQKNKRYALFEKLEALKIFPHPAIDKRLTLLKKAQCIYDKYN